MARFLNEFEVKTLPTREDLGEYVQFRKDNDIWLNPVVRSTSAVGFDPLKTTADEIEENNYVSLPDNAINAAMEGTQLLLVFPRNFKAEIAPIRYTAFGDIEARAGLFGPTLERSKDRGDIEALSAIIKGQFLSTGLSLNGETGWLLLRDEMVNTFKSQYYQPFAEGEMIKTLEEHLLNVFPNYYYKTGEVSHEMLVARYMLRATAEEESLRLKLQGFNFKVDSLEAGVVFSTSDIGSSAVTVLPLFYINKIPLRLGNPIKLRHDAGNTVEMFKTALEKIALVFTDADEQIEVLGNTQIDFVGNCVSQIAEQASFPKGITDAVVDAIGSASGTAIDVYIALMEIAERIAKTQSVAAAVGTLEKASKLMFVDFGAFDKPFI